MTDVLWAALCGALAAAAALLIGKVVLLRRSAAEIRRQLGEHLETDTNTLLSIPSRDKAMCRLAADLNVQLRRLRGQRQQYQSGNLELKTAVTNISHDLRTPLTAIFGYLELLEGEPQTGEAARYLAVIRDRAEMLSALTEELFRYSVILSGESAGRTEAVALGAVLEESLAAFYTALREAGITPAVRMPPVRVVRSLDRGALARVFSNLLGNAVKYSGGDLEITLTESGVITFSNTAADLGGVEAGRLFDRFYTVEASRQSTGLGLSIARTLVEQMGGTITAQYKGDRLYIQIVFPECQKNG